MKNLNQYIQEKYLINNDTKDIEIPFRSNIDEFCDWVQYEYKCPTADINKFKNRFHNINKSFQDFEIEISNYYDDRQTFKIDHIDEIVKNFKNVKNRPFIKTNNLQLYWLTHPSDLILLCDENKEVQYIFIIEYLLA